MSRRQDQRAVDLVELMGTIGQSLTRAADEVRQTTRASSEVAYLIPQMHVEVQVSLKHHDGRLVGWLSPRTENGVTTTVSFDVVAVPKSTS